MKLISWNCCLPPWSFTRRQRLPLIVLSILKENPDLICLQEIFIKSNAQYFIKEFRQKGFFYSFKYQDLLIFSKIPIFFSRGTKFKNQGKIFSFSALDALYGKAFQIVGLQTEKHKIFLANTHLLSAYAFSGKSYQTARISQIQEIISCLKALTDNNIILAGDFNFEPETTPFLALKEADYTDLSKQIVQTIKDRKLDFIFAKSLAADIIGVKSKFTDFSDHAIQILEFQMRL